MSAPYFVYLLRCGDGSYYTGISTDPLRRAREHNGEGGRGAKYTAARRPVELAGAWPAGDRAAALRLERAVKSLSHREKAALLRGERPRGLDPSRPPAGEEGRTAAGEGYAIVRSARRTLALELRPDGALLVRAPFSWALPAIEDFVDAHGEWIAAHRARLAARREAHPEPTPERERALCARARAELPPLVALWGGRMGLSPAGVRVTGAKTRFGSCSLSGGLCFSFRLMDYPPEAVEYVVVHELCHLVHRDHSARFYALLAQYLPDYRARVAMLRR